MAEENEGGGFKEAWQRSKFKTEEGRWNLGVERTPASSSPQRPSTRPVVAALATADSGKETLILGNEFLVGIYDAMNVDKDASKYFKLPAQTFPTSVTLTADACPKGQDLLLGLNNGEIICSTILAPAPAGENKPELTSQGSSGRSLMKAATAFVSLSGATGTPDSAEVMNAASIVVFNQNAQVTGARCNAVAWSPRRQGCFVAAFADGTLCLFDANKDPKLDPGFESRPEGGGSDPKQRAGRKAHSRSNSQDTSGEPDESGSESGAADPGDAGEVDGIVCDPIAVELAKNANAAAEQRWQFTTAPINAVAFSPSGNLLATGGRDGIIRIIDVASGVIRCGTCSYFGSTLCVAWSPDGQVLLAGGEDDNILVWGMKERRVIAWLEGHTSWVSSVIFDKFVSRPEEEEEEEGEGEEEGGKDLGPETAQYRAISGGQDGRICFWDFALEEDEFEAANVPDTPTSGQSMGSDTGGQSLESSPLRLRNLSLNRTSMAYISSSVKRLETSRVAPVVAHHLHPEPIAAVLASQDMVLSIDLGCMVRMWMRPHKLNRPNSGSLED